MICKQYSILLFTNNKKIKCVNHNTISKTGSPVEIHTILNFCIE